MANICNVKTKLTTHVGRRTFGQLMLNKGFSIEASQMPKGIKA